MYGSGMAKRGAAAIVVVTLLAACGGGGDDGPHYEGPAQISTFAYVMNECTAAPGQDVGSGRSALWIRQGDRSPAKIVEVILPKYPRDLCLKYGQARAGWTAALVGAFQRLGVTPDGSTVVFEVTDDFSLTTRLYGSFVPHQQEGFWVVRADGRGLHRLADASRQANFSFDWDCLLFEGGTNCAIAPSSGFDVSPNGRQLVFTDRGPDTTGTYGPQLFTLDLATGARLQLTRLPPLPRCREPIDPNAECVPVGRLPIQYPRFLDLRTIAFHRRERASTIVPYTVDIEKKEPTPVPVVAIKGGGLVPIFQITGVPVGFTVWLSDLSPVNGPGPAGNIVTEAFTFNGRDTLQLTAFGRSDTWNTRTTLDRTRVLFQASADPLGSNPAQACEFFSVDPLGGDLRQLTHFGAGLPKGCSCDYCLCEGVPCEPPMCSLGGPDVDQGTGSIAFDSTCDPFGTNPYGNQAFAMWPDGTGLRQLTAARGLREGADGSLAVELPGPWEVATRYR